MALEKNVPVSECVRTSVTIPREIHADLKRRNVNISRTLQHLLVAEYYKETQ